MPTFEDSIADPVAAAANAAPDRPALIHSEGALSYRMLDEAVTGAAGRLRSAGIRRAAFYLESDWRYVVLMLASWRAEIIVCPLSTRAPAAAVGGNLESLRADVLITDSARAAAPVPAKRPETFLRGAAAPVNRSRWRLDAPATLLFTSGTTDAPQPAMHSLGAHVFNALGAREAVPLVAGDRWLLSLPLYHVGGLAIIFRCMLAGAAVVIPPESRPLDESLRQYGVTHVSLVPTQLRRLLSAQGPAPPKLKAALAGGSSLPSKLIDKAHERGLPLHTTYGLTEMGSQVTTTPRNASLSHLHTAGRVLSHRELRIGGDGEILVRGRTLFEGYLRDDALRLPLTEGDWFATGDLGRIDNKGYLSVLGRKDNLFISGGENIHPEEIEAALGRHPAVERAVVVPVDDAEYGARPVAFVSLSDPTTTPGVLRAFLASELPHFKIPDAFFAWKEIPQDACAGGLHKVNRKALAAHAQVLVNG